MSCYQRLLLVLGLMSVILILGCSPPAETTSQSEDPMSQSDERPNLIVILLDDTGYADLGAFGSEISTPNIDRLAAAGVQFSNFHAAASCTPTRGMLLTGVDNHLVGMGNMVEINRAACTQILPFCPVSLSTQGRAPAPFTISLSFRPQVSSASRFSWS